MVQEATASLFNLKSDDAVSVLTSEQRTTWAKVRQHLLDLDPMNKESMLAVESAIFALVLSQDSPTSHEEVAAHALHGDGRNKWFDKPFNLIVHENGRMGLNGEHAWADAIAVVSLFDFVLKDVSRHQPSPRRHGHAAAAATDVVAPEPRHLRWKLDVKVVEAIERASASFAKLIAVRAAPACARGCAAVLTRAAEHGAEGGGVPALRQGFHQAIQPRAGLFCADGASQRSLKRCQCRCCC